MTSLPSVPARVSLVPAAMLLLPVLLYTPLLAAQQATGRVVQDQDAESSSGGGLEEVTVTATRRTETESKVPISITAFTKEQMDSQGLRQVDDLVRFTPGLNINHAGNGGNDVSIRGISSGAGAGTTGIYIDDTPIQVRNIGYNPGTTFPALFDLERVEVLRGPQGTLFGAGSEGGTVRFIQVTPDLHKVSSYARAEVSNTQSGAVSYEAGFAFGAPLIEDHLAFRASAFYRRDGGYVDGVTGTWTTNAADGSLYGNSINFEPTAAPRKDINSSGVDGFRAALKYAPNAAVTVTPSISYQRQNFNNGLDTFWLATSDPGAGRLTRAVFDAGDPATNPALNANTAPNADIGNDRFYLPALLVNVAAGPVDIVSNTSYFNRDEYQWSDDTPLYEWLYGISPAARPGDKSASLYTNSQRNFTEELRVQSSDQNSRVDWVVGLFYSHERQTAGQSIVENFLINAPVLEITGLPPEIAGVAGGSPFGPGSSASINYFGVPLVPGMPSWTADIATLDKQEAAFAQANLKITRQLKLTAGVRVSRNELTVNGTYGGPENNNNYAYAGPCPAGLNAAGTACVDSYPVTQSKRSETATTPKVGLEFQLDDANLFYTTAAKGFRPAGASLLVPVSQCGQDLQDVGYVDPNIPLAAVKQSDSKQPTVFASDSVWSYEVGSKNRLLGGRALVDASFYRISWSNIQSNVALPLCGYSFADNTGHATSQGFDIGLRGTPVRGLELGGTFGYNKTTFDEDARTPNGILLYSKGTGVPGVGAPMSFSASAQYDFNLLQKQPFYIRGDLTHSSTERAAGTTSPTSSTYQPLNRSVEAYSVLNARFGTHVLGGGDLSLFVNNLTNSHPDLGLIRGGAIGGYPSVWTGTTLRPRTYGVTFLYHY